MTTLPPDQRAFLDEKQFGILATVNAQGIPYQVAVWYLLQDAEVLVTTSASAYKVKNIQHNPWASLAVSAGPRYLTVRGRATIASDPAQVQADFVRIVRRYLPPEAADKWIADSQVAQTERVIIHIPIEHFSPQEQ